jgi:Raf kinase inhibitor-like YbhB/YbcL family protein
MRLLSVVAALTAAVALTGSVARGATPYPPLRAPLIPDNLPTLTVTSATFPNNGAIPATSVNPGCGNPGQTAASPQLTWTPGPPGTASYTVTMFDPDAPTGVGFWHWVVFNIPVSVTSLALGADANLPAGAVRGINDNGDLGFRGPCPPVGDPPHHYYVTVSALSTAFSGYPSQVTGARLSFMMGVPGKVLALGQIVGLYGR